MKICYLGNANSMHFRRWVQYFVGRSDEISIITLNNPITGYPGVKIHVLNTKIGRGRGLVGLLFNTLQVNILIKKIRPDIIHFHLIGTLANVVPYINFHPILVSAWGSDVLIRPNKSMLYKWMISKIIKKADMLHCDGNNSWQALEKLGAPSAKIVRIHFGIDTDTFSPKKRSMEFRENIGVGQSPVIISTRGLSPIYDIATLIHAIPKVIKEIPDAKFIIGSSGPLREKLEELVKNLNVSDNTMFTGRISDEDFPYYVASADIYVSTSLSDAGLASSTGEAMACGLPVIVTEDPDNRDWIEDGVNGFVIPVKNPDILADRIIELVKNENLRREFGKLNRGIIAEKNDYYTEMGKMEKEYMKLISKVVDS